MRSHTWNADCRMKDCSTSTPLPTPTQAHRHPTPTPPCTSIPTPTQACPPPPPYMYLLSLSDGIHGSLSLCLTCRVGGRAFSSICIANRTTERKNKSDSQTDVVATHTCNYTRTFILTIFPKAYIYIHVAPECATADTCSTTHVQVLAHSFRSFLTDL